MKNKILNIIDKISTIVIRSFFLVLVSAILVGALAYIIMSSFSVNSLTGIVTTLIVFSILWIFIRDLEIWIYSKLVCLI